jgi:uroporphyrinogen-III synthase
MSGTTAISIVKFFFNEEKRWLNRETLAKNGERVAEESREFFNNPAKKNGQKEREKKKRLSKRQSLQ